MGNINNPEDINNSGLPRRELYTPTEGGMSLRIVGGIRKVVLATLLLSGPSAYTTVDSYLSQKGYEVGVAKGLDISLEELKAAVESDTAQFYTGDGSILQIVNLTRGLMPQASIVDTKGKTTGLIIILPRKESKDKNGIDLVNLFGYVKMNLGEHVPSEKLNNILELLIEFFNDRDRVEHFFKADIDLFDGSRDGFTRLALSELFGGKFPVGLYEKGISDNDTRKMVLDTAVPAINFCNTDSGLELIRSLLSSCEEIQSAETVTLRTLVLAHDPSLRGSSDADILKKSTSSFPDALRLAHLFVGLNNIGDLFDSKTAGLVESAALGFRKNRSMMNHHDSREIGEFPESKNHGLAQLIKSLLLRIKREDISSQGASSYFPGSQSTLPMSDGLARVVEFSSGNEEFTISHRGDAFRQLDAYKRQYDIKFRVITYDIGAALSETLQARRYFDNNGKQRIDPRELIDQKPYRFDDQILDNLKRTLHFNPTIEKAFLEINISQGGDGGMNTSEVIDNMILRSKFELLEVTLRGLLEVIPTLYQNPNLLASARDPKGPDGYGEVNYDLSNLYRAGGTHLGLIEPVKIKPAK